MIEPLGIEPTPDMTSFLRERHLASLSLVRPDQRVHVTPVGFTWDPEAGLVRVITWVAAVKARLLQATGPLPAAVCQVDGARWATIEGVAVVTADPDRCCEGVRRYEERYGPASDRGAERRVIEISPTHVMGRT